jgi:hypothetical protein
VKNKYYQVAISCSMLYPKQSRECEITRLPIIFIGTILPTCYIAKQQTSGIINVEAHTKKPASFFAEAIAED